MHGGSLPWELGLNEAESLSASHFAALLSRLIAACGIPGGGGVFPQVQETPDSMTGVGQCHSTAMLPRRPPTVSPWWHSESLTESIHCLPRLQKGWKKDFQLKTGSYVFGPAKACSLSGPQNAFGGAGGGTSSCGAQRLEAPLATEIQRD